jgi:toxin ParE1/3/4
MRIVWSEASLVRVEDAASYIASDSPVAAARWVEELFDHVESQLSRFPESAPVVPELTARGVRGLVFGDYRVFYRIEDASTLVITVLHDSQLLRDTEFGD